MAGGERAVQRETVKTLYQSHWLVSTPRLSRLLRGTAFESQISEYNPMKTQVIAPEAPQGLARRSFLAGLAITAPIAATAATPALAAPGASRGAIDELYAERTALAARSRILDEQWKAAHARLPWWAKPGPCYLRGDGKWTGAHTGWPAIDDGRTPSSASAMILKRPRPSDIREDFEFGVRIWGEKRRPEFRALYRNRMLALVSRRRRQRDERRQAGLPTIEDELDTLGERLGEIDDRLEDLEVQPADLPQKAAAVLLIASIYDRGCNYTFGRSATLDALRPLLTGQIREHADHVVANPDDEMWSMPFYSFA
jgi:hypothetical protein